MNLSDSRAAGPQPIVRVSAAEAVFSSIRDAIESGELPVGSKLSAESVLAAQYAVSRSVIREALRSCAALGLTQTQTGKGTFEAMEDEDDPEMWVTLDASFHATIAAASGNGVFARVVNDIRDAMVNQSETINLITGRQHPSNAEHREILAAIEAGDGPAA